MLVSRVEGYGLAGELLAAAESDGSSSCVDSAEVLVNMAPASDVRIAVSALVADDPPGFMEDATSGPTDVPPGAACVPAPTESAEVLAVGV